MAIKTTTGVDLSMNEYQDVTGLTAVYPGERTLHGVTYVVLGLAGEAGETANKLKKILRNEQNYMDKREILMDELGDVLWYAARLADELGYTLEEVAQFNMDKLAKRKAEGTLKDRPVEVHHRVGSICIKS